MNYYSINKVSPTVDFRTATINGLAPDKGLYFPEFIPTWNKDFINNLSGLDKTTIGVKIMRPYVRNAIPDNVLKEIIHETLAFDFPLTQIDENIYCLELFHGPTLAFKDLGARFLSRCIGYFAKEKNEKIIILVATSGDTGGAVADGFYNVPGTEVIILYPSGKVSEVQEKQLTALGGNIHALEVEGDFDDCQRLVKMAFADSELHNYGMLTSANSINISRWLSQQVYYALALAQWKEKSAPVISVPSGNFGNICAGLVAQRSGLPVKQFIAACNTNDVFTRYLETGVYNPSDSIQTISNAMDVGDPSNFIRILELFNGDYELIKKHITSYSYTDEATASTIAEVYKKKNIILDPHTAVSYAAMKRWQSKHPTDKGIILGTAHPLKFAPIVEKIISHKVEMPQKLDELMKKTKKSTKIKPSFAIAKQEIINILSI